LSALHLHFLGTGKYEYIWILVVDFCEFIMEFALFGLFVWFWYNEARENSENEPIQPPYLGKFLLSTMVHHFVVLFILAILLPFMANTLLGWYLFVRIVLALLLMISKSVLFFNYNLYKTGRPIQKELAGESKSYF